MTLKLPYFKTIFYFVTSEHERRFSEFSAIFAYNALKIDAYTHIWPMFHFSPIKTPKALTFF